MVDWQVTATTIFCESVADEVTVLVRPDWKVSCSGFVKYSESRKASVELVKRMVQLRKSLGCQGVDCPAISQYIFKLQAEEDRMPSRSGETT